MSNLIYLKPEDNIYLIMAGGLIQLAAYGSENLYLMGNPQITFFKNVYKHHTNFSIESMELPFTHIPNISEMSNGITNLKIKIPRNADLLSSVFLKVELPSILSSIYKKFEWVENLGEVMIQNVSLLIGGQKIQCFTSDWLHIYHNLNLSSDKKKIYDILIGNIESNYHPGVTDNQFYQLLKKQLLENNTLPQKNNLFNYFLDLISKINSVSDGLSINESNLVSEESIPDIIKSLFPLLKQIDNLKTNNTPYYNPTQIIQSGEKLKPTIYGNCLYIPIPFFFSEDIGLSLPLVALQYQEVEIDIEFSPISHLFTILEWNKITQKYVRKRPNSLNKQENLSYFTFAREPISIPKKSKIVNNISELNCEKKNNGYITEGLDNEVHIQNAYNDLNYKFNISLEVFYIFLDDNERNLFSKKSHEYLITQLNVRNSQGFHGAKSQFSMSLYNPVKELYWTLSRSDISIYNKWFNYTNIIDINNFSQDKSSILLNSNILFNGIDRIAVKNYQYFNYLQSYLYHTKYLEGVYIYSFSLSPENFQPSGCVNMSMINDVTLSFQTQIPPIDNDIDQFLKNKGESQIINQIKQGSQIELSKDLIPFLKDGEMYQYTYDLNVYIVNYNVLKIMSGSAGLSYTS